MAESTNQILMRLGGSTARKKQDAVQESNLSAPADNTHEFPQEKKNRLTPELMQQLLADFNDEPSPQD